MIIIFNHLYLEYQTLITRPKQLLCRPGPRDLNRMETQDLREVNCFLGIQSL